MDQQVQHTHDDDSDFATPMVEGMTVATMQSAMLEVVKGTWRLLPDRFDALPAQVQEEHTDRAALAIDKAVRRAVDMLAANGRVSVAVDIDKVTFGDDDIRIALKAGKAAPDRHAIADSAGGSGRLVLPEYPAMRTKTNPEPAKPVDTTLDLFEDGTPKADADPAGDAIESAPEPGPLTDYLHKSGAGVAGEDVDPAEDHPEPGETGADPVDQPPFE